MPAMAMRSLAFSALVFPLMVAGDIAIAAAFPAEFAGAYKVDTRYTDFFGRDATCAVDSILVRV